jgi:hypothetical protein
MLLWSSFQLLNTVCVFSLNCSIGKWLACLLDDVRMACRNHI